MKELQTRINEPNELVQPTQATVEGLTDTITITTDEVVGYNGKIQLRWSYEILGEVYTTNKELTQDELSRWLEVIKETR